MKYRKIWKIWNMIDCILIFYHIINFNLNTLTIQNGFCMSAEMHDFEVFFGGFPPPKKKT